ncbi:MAG: Ig-like domain-containing protein [Janthinobacterium lividum]
MRVTALFFCILLFLSAAAGRADETPPTFPAFDRVETHRIRLVNSVDGAIQVSDDQGKNWHLIGRVTAPATESLMGYSAAGYAVPGTVAATAVHGLRIRVGDNGTPDPLLINILPREFTQTPKLFGGHVSGLSGVYTTIPVGTSIFRGLSPLVGNSVYLEHGMGSDLEPLPVNYIPRDGDILEIVVLAPTNPLKEVFFDNKAGGEVRATYADNATKLLTHVVKPVVGIGRYDGCSYTGVGAINTNHDGVITVSTAPVSTSPLFEGIGPERRGGFQIQPAFHNAQGDGAGAPSVLVIGSHKRPATPEMEGRPPLFYGYFDLAWSADEPQHSWRTEVQRRNGPWVPMPTLIGSKTLALADVTALRLVRTSAGDKSWRDGEIQAAVAAYSLTALADARAGKSLVERGQISFSVAAPDLRTAYISFYRDGQFVGITNSVPYTFHWDTTTVPDGEYVIEAEAQDANNQPLTTTRTKIWVDNQRKVAGH